MRQQGETFEGASPSAGREEEELKRERQTERNRRRDEGGEGGDEGGRSSRHGVPHVPQTRCFLCTDFGMGMHAVGRTLVRADDPFEKTGRERQRPGQ